MSSARRRGSPVGEPALGEADEDAREAARAGRVVVVRELARATGEEHDDRHDELGLDRRQEAGLLEALGRPSPTVSVTIRE